MPKGYITRKTRDKEQARAALREMVMARLEPMVEAQVAHAQGIKFLVVRERKGGKFKRVTETMARAAKDGRLGSDEEIIEVWEKEPSVLAFTDLMNRTLDKPAEHVAISGELTVNALERRLKAGRERVAKKRGNGQPHA